MLHPLKDLQNGSVADPLRAACVDVKSADDSNFTSRVSHHCRKQSKRLIVVWFFFVFFSANDASYKHRKESQRESEVQFTVFSHLFSPHFFQCQISRLEISKRACYHIIH